MADWNRYRRQEQRDDYDRSPRRDRQHEQFQNDRSYGSDDYAAGSSYGQMGDDHSQGRYGSQYDEGGYQSDRSGGSWRDERSNRNRDRGSSGYQGDASGGFGAARYTNREPGGFDSFTSETYRTGGNVGPRQNMGYGRGDDYRSGAYSGGSYGAGSYGAAPRRDYDYDDRSGSRGDRGFFDRAGDEVASWFGDEDAARRREMDHRGRGPSNYTRSDERVLEDACDKLTQDYGVDARNIQVTVQDGEVTLDGTVSDRRQKRRAEDVVHEVSGVGHVQNNLRTQDNARSSGSDNSSLTTAERETSERNTGTLA